MSRQKWQITRSEIERLQLIEKKYNSMKENEIIEPFVDRMLDNIGMMLAHSYSFDSWPSFCKVAFEQAKIDFPAGAELYKSRKDKIDFKAV